MRLRISSSSPPSPSPSRSSFLPQIEDKTWMLLTSQMEIKTGFTESLKSESSKNKTQFVHFLSTLSFCLPLFCFPLSSSPSVSFLRLFVFLLLPMFPSTPRFFFFSAWCYNSQLLFLSRALISHVAVSRQLQTHTHACNHMYSCTCTGMEVIKAQVKGRAHYPQPVKTFGVFYALVSIKEA